MKSINKNNRNLLYQAPELMRSDGFEPLTAGVLEKDMLVTEIISAFGHSFSQGDYRPVFCGGTCLSKAYGTLERMSEDVDFKVVHINGFSGISKSQARKDLSALKGEAAKILERLGYLSDDLNIRARDDNRYIMIEAHYQSMFERNGALREPIQLELNATTMQMAPRSRPVSRVVDQWLHPTAIPRPGIIDCVDPLEAVAEKLIAFPRRYAHHARGLARGETRAFDSTLVRHLYDVCRMRDYMQDIDSEQIIHSLRPMMRRLVLKDAREFQHQHPEFVDDAHGEIAEFMKKADSPSMRKLYDNFVDAMVYAPEQRRPSFDQALDAFTGLLDQIVYGPSPNIRAQMEKEQEALAQENQVKAKQSARPPFHAQSLAKPGVVPTPSPLRREKG